MEKIHDNMCKEACSYVSYKKTTSKHMFSCIFCINGENTSKHVL